MEKKEDIINSNNSNKITQEEKYLLDNLIKNEQQLQSQQQQHQQQQPPPSPSLKLNNSSISLKDSNFDLSSTKGFESTCLTSPIAVSPSIVNKISLISSSTNIQNNNNNIKLGQNGIVGNDNDIDNQELININLNSNKKSSQTQLQPPAIPLNNSNNNNNNFFKPLTPSKFESIPQNSFTYEKTPTINKHQQQSTPQNNYNVKSERSSSPIPFPNISMLINEPPSTSSNTTNRLKTPLSTPIKSTLESNNNTTNTINTTIPNNIPPTIELNENDSKSTSSISSASNTSTSTTINTNEQPASIPISTSTSASTNTNKFKHPSWSFKNYLWDEIHGGYLSTEVIDSKKREQVYNFVHVPLELEKLILFGFLVCFDSFLFLFTFLPIRFFLSFFKLLQSLFSSKTKLTTNQIFDLIRGFIWVSCFIFLTFIDSSMLYHYIRGQAVIKLYVIYNVLEVLDKLCCSFGQDIFDSLYWMSYSFSNSKEIKERSQKETRILAPVSHTIVATGYVFLHSLVLFSQVITLNVAINSYNNALLTLMISNQFVELKGSVFKRFEKENLFQISCSDIVERFQAFIFLMIIAFQNLSDLNWDLSKDYFFDMGLVFITVLGSELVVDAIKHAFITKFNKIPPKMYTKFFIILSDNIVDPRNRNFTESSWGINNIIGFVPFPLASIIIRFFYKFIPFDNIFTGIVLTIQIYICLVLLKIFIKIVIIGQCLSNNISLNDPTSVSSSSTSISEKLNEKKTN